MTTELPEPKSRKESYLAKAAGMDTTIPEKPESREEQYLEAIAEGGGGGGGSYTAGNGIDITDSTISVDTTVVQEKLTAGDNITITDNTISATGGSVTVAQTTGTSTTDVMSQDAATKMLYPSIGTYPDSINIRGTSGIDISTAEYAIAIGGNSAARGERAVAIGFNASSAYDGDRSVSIGNFAKVNNNSKGIAIGNLATCSNPYSIAFGSSATTSRVGEVNIGAGTSGEGYNSTNYRLIGGVHDGQLAQDAVTVAQVNATIDAINTALSTSIPHIGATS